MVQGQVGGRREAQRDPVGLARIQRGQVGGGDGAQPGRRWQEHRDRAAWRAADVGQIKFHNLLFTPDHGRVQRARNRDQIGGGGNDAGRERIICHRALGAGHMNPAVDDIGRADTARSQLVREDRVAAGVQLIGQADGDAELCGGAFHHRRETAERQIAQVLQRHLPDGRRAGDHRLVGPAVAEGHAVQSKAALEGIGGYCGMIGGDLIRAGFGGQRPVIVNEIAGRVCHRGINAAGVLHQDPDADRHKGCRLAGVRRRVGMAAQRDHRSRRCRRDVALDSGMIGGQQIQGVGGDKRVVGVRGLIH